ncbi:PTS ascorbate transporter subunit IIC [Spiroplasma clarkii]|uniref:Ascorbate-specific PTS system EIIC component n=1 Tax=Spiroplasma clarkii TaxID=2139 RepID=A0A1Y0L1C1_9MOLU|nr:PTS ascorbate transporter subunit IIC [Spiroplasma clarkii]ARU91786.1 PTS ascorbate transporter subunit IIC [Spiroplasma clarkii]ATX71153.1 PTS system, ascorbate-specific IIC component [Spiroplasma clarkii]
MDEFIIFLKTFFGTPSILIGIVAMIGLLIQRKSFTQVLTGTFKVIIGFLILGGGATLLSSSLSQFSPVFINLFGINGAIPNNEATMAQLLDVIPKIITIGTGVMIVAMLTNVVLAIVTRYKYVYLTGHVLFYMSVMTAACLVSAGMDDSKDLWMIILTGGLFMAIYMLFMPLANQKFMRQVTKGDVIAMGHTGGIGYFIAGWIGNGIGALQKGKVRSTEDIKFPKGLSFLKNSNVAISITMIFFFLIVYIAAYAAKGLDVFIGTDVLDGTGAMANHWFVFAIIQAFTFAAGIEVILLGVRMVLNELVPAFKGISDKFVKNGKAALDCAVVFTYAPNAVLIGFLASFVAGIIGMFITYGAGLPIVLPGIAAHFFLGATGGVFANSKGGIWGAIVGPFVQGLIITFVPVLFLKLNAYAGVEASISTGWGDTDYILGLIPLLITRHLGKWVTFGVVLAFIIGLVVEEQIFIQIKRKKAKLAAPSSVVTGVNPELVEEVNDKQ